MSVSFASQDSSLAFSGTKPGALWSPSDLALPASVSVITSFRATLPSAAKRLASFARVQRPISAPRFAAPKGRESCRMEPFDSRTAKEKIFSISWGKSIGLKRNLGIQKLIQILSFLIFLSPFLRTTDAVP